MVKIALNVNQDASTARPQLAIHALQTTTDWEISVSKPVLKIIKPLLMENLVCLSALTIIKL